MLRCSTTLFCIAILCASSCRQKPHDVETALYFGLAKPDGATIADSSWQRFVSQQVLRVFPKGFTVIPASGVWKGNAGTVSENTMVIVSLNEMDDGLSARIDSLRERYKSEFAQKSVMRVDIATERWDF